MASGHFLVPIQRMLILIAAGTCRSYKEKLTAFLSDPEIMADPSLLEDRSSDVAKRAIGVLREQIAQASPALLCLLDSPLPDSTLATITFLDKLEGELQTEAAKIESVKEIGNSATDSNLPVPDGPNINDSEMSRAQATIVDPPLGERAQLVLVALRDGKAFDSDHRMRTADITLRAAGKAADPNQYKEVVAQLKQLGYVATQKGRSGGCWLTDAGQTRATQL
jgi:hypothetical protein